MDQNWLRENEKTVVRNCEGVIMVKRLRIVTISKAIIALFVKLNHFCGQLAQNVVSFD